MFLFLFYKFEINEQVDMIRIIIYDEENQTFLGRLIAKYKEFRGKIAENDPRQTKWTEPNFHKLKVIAYFGGLY